MLQTKTKKYKTLLPVYLKGLTSGKYTLRQASESTGYTITHLWRLKKRYQTEGLLCLESRRLYTSPVNRIPQDLRNRIVALYATPEYEGLNFKYYCEALEDYEDIKINYQTLRRIMKEAGVKSPRAHHVRTKNKVHQPRPRRECEGDLWQIDGTPFEWFKKYGNNKKYCIHAGVDDATSKITAMYMTENECVYGYNEILRITALKHGLPRECYSDRAAIFCVTPKEKRNLSKWEELAGLHEKRTQWQRILEDLNIRQVLAWSPQAKGRVERLWEVVQDRLPFFLYKNGCDTVEEANKILPKFVEYYNKKFAVSAKDDDDFYIAAPKNLDDILTVQIPRQTYLNGEFSFYGYKWIVKNCQRISHRKFTLTISERGIYAYLDGLYYPVQLLEDLQEVDGENMTQVLKNIIYRYMFAPAKELSA